MNNDFNQNTNNFTNNGSNMENQQFNNVNFQNNGANNNQVQGNEGVNQNNAQVSNNMNNYNNQSQGRNFNNYNQPNNEPQNKTSTVNYSGQIHSNKNPIDNKKILKIIIGVVIAVIVVFVLSKLFVNKSGGNYKTNNIDNGKSVFTISINDFDANDDTFKKYINKRITVTDVRVINLDGISFGPLPYKVDCSNMSSLDVSEGDIISVTGTLNDKTYHGLWYYMDNCSISK